MARGRAGAWFAATLALLACSGPSFRARLDDAGGLAEGAPVQVAGARVGEVKGVRLLESGEVEVAFALERGHQLQLHLDACAVVVPDADRGPRLEVMPGDEGGELGAKPIPRCPSPMEELGALGEVLGEGLGRLMEGVAQGMQKTQGGAGIVGDVLEQIAQQQRSSQGGTRPPDAPAVPCAGLTVRVEGTRELPASRELPSGGQVITVALVNRNAYAFRMPAIGNARFLNAEGGALAAEPVEGNTWRMPFDVPAAGQARVSVVLGGHDRLTALEVRPVTRADEPLTTCTLSAEGL